MQIFFISGCRCLCLNESDSKLKELMTETKRQLTKNKKELSSYIRKKTSAEDNRPIAKAIGIPGGVILVICLLCVIVPDLPLLRRHCKKAWKNVRSRFKNKKVPN